MTSPPLRCDVGADLAFEKRLELCLVPRRCFEIDMVLGQQALQLASKLFLLQSVADLVQIDEDVEGVLFLSGLFDPDDVLDRFQRCLLYTSPSPRD